MILKRKESSDQPSNDLSELSGVSIEQMQSDFESIANANDCVEVDENLFST